MQTFTVVVERDRDTGFYVGYVPNIPGAHFQGETLDELCANLLEFWGCCRLGVSLLSRGIHRSGVARLRIWGG
jgi:hypothetical protein